MDRSLPVFECIRLAASFLHENKRSNVDFHCASAANTSRAPAVPCCHAVPAMMRAIATELPPMRQYQRSTTPAAGKTHLPTSMQAPFALRLGDGTTQFEVNPTLSRHHTARSAGRAAMTTHGRQSSVSYTYRVGPNLARAAARGGITFRPGISHRSPSPWSSAPCRPHRRPCSPTSSSTRGRS